VTSEASAREVDKRGPVERLFSLFADVQAGEAATVVLLTIDVFLLLLAYYLLKTVREPLILAGGGAEVKSYASAGQAVLMIFWVLGFSWLAARVDRIKLITIVTYFFGSNLVIFYLLAHIGVPYLGVAFYLWVGVFNYAIISQFWAFANDVYTPEQGKRLFAIVGIGSSVGAVAGSVIAGVLFKIGPYNLMLVAASILMLCLALTKTVNKRVTVRAKDVAEKKPDDGPLSKQNGLKLILKSRYLLMFAAIILLNNWVNSAGEYILDRQLSAAAVGKSIAEQEQFFGTFKAQYFSWVNIVGVVLQLFVVSRVFKYLGVRAALFAMPLVSFCGYSTMVFAPILSFIFVAKIAENSCDYSIQNTTKQALWLPTSRDEKYKAKAGIDTFVVRFGDMFSAGVVWLGTNVLSFETQHFAIVSVVLVAVWLALCAGIGREHMRLTNQTPEPSGG
jgi:AAA family ATP:ADP antiporter